MAKLAGTKLRKIRKQIWQRLPWRVRYLWVWWMYEQSPKRDFKLATLWQERGQLDRAIATYRQLFAFPKLGERARHELEAIYDAQQDWETALDIRLLDLRDRVSQRPDGEKSPAELERERVVGAAIEAARRRVRSTGPKRFASPQSIDWPADPLEIGRAHV